MAHPNIIKVYVVQETLDDWGRRGSRLGIFTKHEEAEQCAKGRGWYGGPAAIDVKWAIETQSGTFYLLSGGTKERPPHPIDMDLKKQLADEELKKQTLASLTPEQKRVLGIK